LPERTDASADVLERWFQHQGIIDELFAEREAQVEQWGAQDLPLGFGTRGPINYCRVMADQYRQECDEANERGDLTHRHILLEEFYEVLAEKDPLKARDELVQLGACVIKAIEQIDRDKAKSDAPAG